MARPRPDLADHGQDARMLRRGGPDVAGVHGKAVHRRVGERRQVDVRNRVGCENAAKCLRERALLHLQPPTAASTFSWASSTESICISSLSSVQANCLATIPPICSGCPVRRASRVGTGSVPGCQGRFAGSASQLAAIRRSGRDFAGIIPIPVRPPCPNPLGFHSFDFAAGREVL